MAIWNMDTSSTTQMCCWLRALLREWLGQACRWRCRLVGWWWGSWLVSWRWGRLVGWLRLVLGGLGLSLVLHISNITILISMVGDNLDTAIGKGNAVGSAGGIAITGLAVAKVSTGVVILDGILICVLWWHWGRLVVRSGLIGWGWGRLVCRSWVVCWWR